ncbi:hypothetical protein K7X08_024580 [Anisodus acutangulus]|uniref:Bacterial Ig-like domain-containing protein n=1 Tax=Anisodus acutangulus TaxID=402998 RepID=A0A9Q1MA80_9SOLA|nr:hypothetical protein K7X08_024580 [Anisodus acutangulus]
MGRERILWLILHFLVFFVQCDGSEVTLKLLSTPRAFSNRNFAKFAFQVLVSGNESICADHFTYCKLDDYMPAVCEGGEIVYTRLLDGNHTFEVCTNGSLGVGCGRYNWTVDTIPPTAYITTPTSFTNASNVSVNITFSEPCWSQGGFGCSSTNSCNLLVYGAGQVVPNTLSVIETDLKFSVVVTLSTRDQYGRVILVMDKNFCSDPAGNKFRRTENSSLFIHFDRRTVFVDIRTHIPERLLQIDSETRTVLATNSAENMEVYLYFTEPISNSSTEILNSLSISQGLLTPISGNTLGERRFGFQIEGISQTATVTLSLRSNLVLSRQGTSIAPVTPVTFLYDMQRPAVRLSTTSRMRTCEEQIPVLIKFVKPVFGFNSSHVSISGGHLLSFQEMSRSMYSVNVQARDDFVSVNIPENVTGDVAGNGNLQSNILRLKHYTVPTISQVLSIFATAAFVVTSFIAGLLTVSTASLQSVGAYSRPSSLMTSDPARNLFRIACHIQVFALARWLPVTLPVQYYEFARGLQWSVPYFSLPWETGRMHQFMMGPGSPANTHSYGSKIHDFGMKPDKYNVNKAATLIGLPLTPMEYRSIFGSQGLLPEAQYIVDPQYSNGWRDFDRGMFWLAVIGGSLVLLHALTLFVLKLIKDREKRWSYGALVFPRFEIFLAILAIPCICKASVNIVKGGTSAGIAVGILLLGLVSFLLLALFLFLSIGITLGKLLQYKEVHQVGQKFHWYEELVRVTLGPGKRGQWTWKTSRDSTYLLMFGPLFEDLRGPPKYMLSQIAGGNPNKHRDKVIATDDENEDAEAPFIQKVFGILRIYFTFLEFVKRVCLGIVAGTYLKNSSTKTPIVVLLSITSFQLFFMVLKKPFIKKKVQLVEIISVACEIGIFAACIVLVDRDSARNDTKIGITMLVFFFIAFLAQLLNEWYALYRQTKRLGPDDKSFCSGLKAASIGFLLFFIPQRLIRKLESGSALLDRRLKETGDVTSSGDRNRSSESRSSGDKPWLRQFRELAKSSFSKDSNATPNDPSTSRVGWSGFWNPKRSGSSSKDSSVDFKSKPRGLYKDLEAIFASKS